MLLKLTFKVATDEDSLGASNAGGPGSVPRQGTRSHMLQLRPSAVKQMNK